MLIETSSRGAMCHFVQPDKRSRFCASGRAPSDEHETYAGKDRARQESLPGAALSGPVGPAVFRGSRS